MSETTEPQAGTETIEPKPPWGDDPEMYDPAKAWQKIQGLEADKKKLSARPVLDDDAARKLAEYDRLEQASKTELERKTEEVTRWQAEAETWRTASVTNRIEALAGHDFADPTDAATALADPAKYLDAGGSIDEDAIREDLAALLTRKPHWRRQETTTTPVTRLPAPNLAQGSGNGRSAADPAAEFAAILQGQLKGSR